MSDGWVEWDSKARIEKRKKTHQPRMKKKNQTKSNKIRMMKIFLGSLFDKCQMGFCWTDDWNSKPNKSRKRRKKRIQKRNCPFYARIKLNSEVQIKRGKKGRHGYCKNGTSAIRKIVWVKY